MSHTKIKLTCRCGSNIEIEGDSLNVAFRMQEFNDLHSCCLKRDEVRIRKDVLADNE